MSNTYNLFISHSWAYGDAYDRLIELLDTRPYFFYKNYSVPKNDPLHTRGTDKDLHAAIKRQIAPCHCVLIFAGVYSTYSKWINKEIAICATEFGTKKPIIAIQPWGAERTSKIVKENADAIVGWNTESIVKAIREVSA
ncbi:TIR domain-containing protein [Undibacterium curvum]|uniref:TIR domain-containing protein n=1 Tax=Undibacterium curvum TaxID=2762294 RepID=A0ABR7A6U2_9BURK|nr:TIR domain-containing protein [Undibacterium curvum]MBC3932618.1 TIR domain-containing protein [Undibacterium curvum]